MVKVKVANSSSRKTREKIKEAFAVSLKEKQSLNKITVTDICQIADITRSAFYTHYDNIYDVAKELQDETLNILISNIDKLKDLNNTELYFDTIFTYIKNNEEIYSQILASDDPLFFTNTLSQLISKYLIDLSNNKHSELDIMLFVNGSFSLLIKYFRKEIHYSLDEINANIKKTFKKLFLNN